MNDRRLPWEQAMTYIAPFEESNIKEACTNNARTKSLDRAIDILEKGTGDPYLSVKSALEELGKIM